MDLTQLIAPGDYREDVYPVEERHSASHVGSGSVKVLATPWMIAFMENTARKMMGDVLPEGYSSVGIRVDVRHLAPTPVGGQARVRVEAQTVEAGKVVFLVQAWDGQEQIGTGTHERAAIDEARFLRRVAAKSGAA
jgi:predicted thioesterase